MRWNTKRFFLVCGAMALLWVFVIYSRSVDVPRSAHVKNEMENRLNKLEKQIYSQYNEITKLLDTVKQHLQTDTVPKEDTKGPGADGHENNEELLEDKKILKTNLDASDYEIFKNECRAVAAPPRSTVLPVLPVLVVACDRVTVKRCLDNLVKFRPNRDTFPIVVSQDCGHNATYQVIKSFVDADPSITVVQQPDLREIPLPKQKVKFRGYYKIARHYRFALNHVFKTMGHEAVIIVEDDLDISPDFFEYFQGTYPLLLQDPSIWCISAWNDNGKKDVIDLEHPELLHRTDFFPGLGWILRKDTWMELEPNWPPAFFDDWLRDPVNTRGRSCIRPEVSRTYSFGKKGVSLGLFFEMHLRHMQLNMDFVEFTKLNLTYLLKLNYDEWFASEVYDAELMTADDVMALPYSAGPPVRVAYLDARSFQKAAKKLGLMDDFRSGIPRTAYKGVVSCFVRGRRVYLAPNFTWTKYDPNWGKDPIEDPFLTWKYFLNGLGHEIGRIKKSWSFNKYLRIHSAK